MDWIDYRKRLGIGLDDREQASYFSSRMHNQLSQMQHYFLVEEYRDFCNMTGIEIDEPLSQGNYFDEVEDVLEDNSSSIAKYLLYYIAFVNCKGAHVYDGMNIYAKREDYIRLVKEELNSAKVKFDIYEINNEYYIFPKGIEEFDQELVAKPLTWLSGYPDAEQAWEKAVLAYAGANPSDASEVADLFRKALETFFKSFFNTRKSLENSLSDYGNYLKSKDIPADISNNFLALLKMYTNYNNDYAKHNDGVDIKVLEYIMYQTGNIIRLLLTLNEN